jgi:hypothetical protein
VLNELAVTLLEGKNRFGQAPVLLEEFAGFAGAPPG